jgi:hypothetical protein
VGFHGAVNPNTGQPGHFNLKIAVYLGYLGFSYDAVEWILGAPPLAIRWLTPETAKHYSIYYSELMPRRSVPFIDDQVPSSPLAASSAVEPATSVPLQPPPAPQPNLVFPEQSSPKISLLCVADAAPWDGRPAGDRILVKATEAAGLILHVVHEVDGQRYDRNMQYRIFKFRRDESRANYYWDGVQVLNDNVLMTGHLFRVADTWYYNEIKSFRDNSQPVSVALPNTMCRPAG